MGKYISKYTGQEIDEKLRPYKVYTALLTQIGIDDPVAVVFENTLGGDIVWARTSQGYYEGVLADAFTENKTFFLVTSNNVNYDTSIKQMSCVWNTTSKIVVLNGIIDYDGGFNGGNYYDYWKYFIEIRVYD
ncbi:MAG: hypothetical protein KGZ85_08060 [Ignavibacterium sp.]|nr:hypothetical protein [Ignavibacterium sp.]